MMTLTLLLMQPSNRLFAFRHRKANGNAKVNYVETEVIGTEQNVARLQVRMNDILGMEVGKAIH